MAKLSTARRKSLPKSEFGLPGKRAYPMPDRAHAANAKARAKQQLNKGNLSESSYRKIVKKANAVEKRTGGTPKRPMTMEGRADETVRKFHNRMRRTPGYARM